MRQSVPEKLDVEYGGEYRTRKSVQLFVAEILAPINSGLLNPQSTTRRGIASVWNNHLKPRMGKTE